MVNAAARARFIGLAPKITTCISAHDKSVRLALTAISTLPIPREALCSALHWMQGAAMVPIGQSVEPVCLLGVLMTVRHVSKWRLLTHAERSKSIALTCRVGVDH